MSAHEGEMKINPKPKILSQSPLTPRTAANIESANPNSSQSYILKFLKRKETRAVK